MSRCARCGAEISIPGETCARCGFVSERGGPLALRPDPDSAPEAAPRDDSASRWITTVAVLVAGVLIVGAAGLWTFGRRAPPDLGGSPLVYPSTSVTRGPVTSPTTISPRRSTTTAAPGPPIPGPTTTDPKTRSTTPVQWKHYSSPDGALEADFPATPTASPLQDVTTCSLSGNQVQQDDGQSVYIVTYGLTQADCKGGQLTSELLHAAVGTLGPTGQILNVTQGLFKEYTMTSFDLSAGSNDIKGKGAIIVTAGHYFLVIAAGPTRNAVEFERFLSSLQVS